MRSCIVGQIHDSIVADVHKDEVQDYLILANDVMTKQVRKAYPEVLLPLTVDAEIAPVGTSWHNKKDFDLAGLVA